MIKALPANDIYTKVAAAYKSLLDDHRAVKGIMGVPTPLDVADAVVPLFFSARYKQRPKEATCRVRLDQITDELLDGITVSNRVVKSWKAEMNCIDCDWSRKVNYRRGDYQPAPERYPEYIAEDVALVAAHVSLYDHAVEVITRSAVTRAVVAR